MFVKPAEGRAVRWPGTRRLLAAEGAEVPADSFWLLCRRNGDVVDATPEPEPTPAQAEAAPAAQRAPETEAPAAAPAAVEHEGAAA